MTAKPLRLLTSITRTLLITFTLVNTGCQRAFFYPNQDHFWDPQRVGAEYEEVYFESADGVMLHGWFLPAQTEKPTGTVLHLHGNAQNISTHIVSVWWLPRHGFNVFTFDYRGFGHSQGKPDFAGVHKDATAAIETVLADKRVAQERLIVFGQSIGASIAITALAKWEGEDPVGLVAETPFASYRQITREVLGHLWLTWPFQYPLSWLVTDAYSPVEHIDQLGDYPLLLIAASEDETTPPHHAEKLYDSANPPKSMWLIKGAGHGLPMADANVRLHLLETLRGWLEGDKNAAQNAPTQPWRSDPPQP